ncbi:MAG: hypothetical protein AAB624_00485 [Patescibacteria group bacterium]
MNNSGKRLVFVAVAVILLIVAGVVNFFVYPFTSAQPNFADVERVFNKIEIPADWVEIDSSENSGIAGRACPIESSGCFHRSVTSNAPLSTTPEQVQAILGLTDCPLPEPQRLDLGDGNDNSYKLICSIEGLEVVGNIRYLDDAAEIFITVRT